MEENWITIAAVLGSIVASIIAAVAAASTQGYKVAVKNLEDRVNTLEGELVKTRDEREKMREHHNDCLKVQQQQQAEINALKTQLATLTKGAGS